jgi:proteasome accessory factor A
MTRQLFAGVGKMGIEAESPVAQPGVFQISQRADFFSALVSIDTMNKRPLVNTRDEPHADAQRYRRFHVIIGDSNMSEWATALKAGTTALVLELVERGKAPQIEIAQPINATRSISRDQNYDWIIELSDGRKISAIDVQRLYLEAAQQLASENAETIWLLREWETVLNDLECDVALTRDRVDWVAKKSLLTEFREAEKLSWTDPWLQGIDLEYHNILPDQGLFHELARQGSMRNIVSEDEIKSAIFTPPETTRAWFRGRSVARFNDAIRSIQWDEIAFTNGASSYLVTLPEPAGDTRLEALNALVREETAFPEFFRALARY